MRGLPSLSSQLVAMEGWVYWLPIDVGGVEVNGSGLSTNSASGSTRCDDGACGRGNGRMVVSGPGFGQGERGYRAGKTLEDISFGGTWIRRLLVLGFRLSRSDFSIFKIDTKFFKRALMIETRHRGPVVGYKSSRGSWFRVQ